MTNLGARMLRRVLLHTLGTERTARIIAWTARLLNLDLIALAYRDAGVLNYEDQTVSGERFVRARVLPALLVSKSPTIVDVGANVGEVSLDLRGVFPAARIWAFEPNPVTFAELGRRVENRGISCENIGLGAEPGEGELHCYTANQQSGHASMYRDVFSLYQENYGIKESAELTTFRFPILTLDDYCRSQGITEIDFLKIDVEGHELSVMRGASGLLGAGKIALIQFEITDCNVMSRVFMRDFYQQLPDFHFYRLKASGLLPLGAYQARHEIFQFQNILAVRKDLTAHLGELTIK